MSQIIEMDYLISIITPLLDVPADIDITRKVDERGILMVLRVNQVDMGKVIGKAGATALALRQMLHVFGVKNQQRISLKIEDPIKTQHKASDDVDLSDL